MDFVLLNGGASGAALSGTSTGRMTLRRHCSPTSTLLVPLNVTGDLTDGVLWFGTSLAETAANALKSSGHSLYAANEGVNGVIPRWDRDHGYAEIGSNTARIRSI
jgi:hypothetical protein